MHRAATGEGVHAFTAHLRPKLVSSGNRTQASRVAVERANNHRGIHIKKCEIEVWITNSIIILCKKIIAKLLLAGPCRSHTFLELQNEICIGLACNKTDILDLHVTNNLCRKHSSFTLPAKLTVHRCNWFYILRGKERAHIKNPNSLISLSYFL